MPGAHRLLLSAGPPPPTPQEQLPDLNTHFRSQSFHTSMYASSWFLTLFLTTFPLPVATRVFDIFMYEVRTPSPSCSPKGPTLEINSNPGRAGVWGGIGEALSPLPLQGLEIVFRVGLALLQVNQVELMQLDMEGMSQVGQGPRKGGIAPPPSRGTWAGEVRRLEFLSSPLFYPL